MSRRRRERWSCRPVILPARLLTVGVLSLSACLPDTEEAEWPEDEVTFPPTFELAQEETFSLPGAQPLAWADYDNDGDLDLFIGFRGAENRLYRNDEGVLVDVAPALGLNDPWETRAAAWGDYDGDGDLDLFGGFRFADGVPNRLYRNEDSGAAFTEVGAGLGLDLLGNTRQTSWLDYDGDGDLDLFMAFREQPNRMFRNELWRVDSRGRRIGGVGEPSFTDVTEESGLGDPRRTVGVAWFDMEEDGDLDAFVTNQNGDLDAFYRNDGGIFTDIASELGMDGSPRTEEYGGVGPALADYDADGDLDLFVANYGPDALWRNDGDGTFTEVGASTPLGEDYHSTAAGWGDFDHDGFGDLFVVSYLSGVAEVEDHLFRNSGHGFENVTPEILQHPGASHGVSWADYDGDGDLDLLLANNHPDGGGHPLFRNLLPEERARRSLQVQVLDANGVSRFPGAEVRIFEDSRGGDDAAGQNQGDAGRLLGTGIVDTGGGYCSQGVAPVHFGIPPGVRSVTVEVAVPDGGVRRLHTIRGVPIPLRPRGVLEIRLPEVF